MDLSQESRHNLQENKNVSIEEQYVPQQQKQFTQENQQVQEQKLQALVQYKRLTGWATFMGVFAVVKGLVLCLGIVTAIIGVPLIIAGLRLTGAVDSMKEFSYANDVNKLSDMVDKLNTYFRIYGILTLIGLLVGFISLIALITYSIYSGNTVLF